MQTLAPIALFVYNRPHHTSRTIKFLQQNILAKESQLFIFSDAAKDSNQQRHVDQVREFIKQVDGFKSVVILERETNFGLANSIIDGVSSLVSEFGKVIVFEDDLISSTHTLSYFNEALTRYQNDEKVMHIGAYMYPLKGENLPEIFFYRAATSWAWATWDRAWKNFEPDIDKIIDRFDSKMKHAFSIEGTMNFWKQIEEFKKGRNNSWAIRWYASIFLKGGLTLNPSKSMINNIGHDGSGIHSGLNDIYHVIVHPLPVSSFPDQVEENLMAYTAIKDFLKNRKGNIWQRILRFAKQKIKH